VTWLRNILILSAIAFVGWEGIAWWYFPTTSLNYKLAVDVNDNGAKYHGEGVVRIDFRCDGFLLKSGAPWTAGVGKGEAITIDLGTKGLLFILLPTTSGAGGLNTYFDFYVNDLPGDRNGLAAIEAFKTQRMSADIKLNALPILVRFRDINAPNSIEQVFPDHLENSLGLGVMITLARASITDEPVTTGIERKLPHWFAVLRKSGARFDGDNSEITRSGASLANLISTSEFQRIIP